MEGSALIELSRQQWDVRVLWIIFCCLRWGIPSVQEAFFLRSGIFERCTRSPIVSVWLLKSPLRVIAFGMTALLGGMLTITYSAWFCESVGTRCRIFGPSSPEMSICLFYMLWVAFLICLLLAFQLSFCFFGLENLVSEYAEEGSSLAFIFSRQIFGTSGKRHIIFKGNH